MDTLQLHPTLLSANRPNAQPVEKLVLADGQQRLQQAWQLRTAADFEASSGQKASAGKRYFPHTSLEDIIVQYPGSSAAGGAPAAASPVLSESELTMRHCFVDFLRGVLDLDPRTRWTPTQASQHPFITGQPYTGPCTPPAVRRWCLLCMRCACCGDGGDLLTKHNLGRTINTHHTQARPPQDPPVTAAQPIRWSDPGTTAPSIPAVAASAAGLWSQGSRGQEPDAMAASLGRLQSLLQQQHAVRDVDLS